MGLNVKILKMSSELFIWPCLVFKQLPRDPENVNAWKICVIPTTFASEIPPEWRAESGPRLDAGWEGTCINKSPLSPAKNRFTASALLIIAPIVWFEVGQWLIFALCDIIIAGFSCLIFSFGIKSTFTPLDLSLRHLTSKVANHWSDQLGLDKFDNIRGYPSILGSKYLLLYFIQ